MNKDTKEKIELQTLIKEAKMDFEHVLSVALQVSNAAANKETDRQGQIADTMLL